MNERLKSQLSALRGLVSPGVELRVVDKGRSAYVFALTRNKYQKDAVNRAYEFILDNIGNETMFVVLPLEKKGLKTSVSQFLEQATLVTSS